MHIVMSIMLVKLHRLNAESFRHMELIYLLSPSSCWLYNREFDDILVVFQLYFLLGGVMYVCLQMQHPYWEFTLFF